MTLWVCLFFNVVFGKTSQILNVEYMCFHINAGVPLLPEVGWLEPLLHFFFFSFFEGGEEREGGRCVFIVCLLVFQVKNKSGNGNSFGGFNTNRTAACPASLCT